MTRTQPLESYRPYGAAARLFTLRDPEILIEGPAGTGKTRGVLEKVNAVLCKYAKARGVIVRKTRASMTQTALVTFEEKVLPRNPQLYPVIDDVLRRNRQSYQYPNGSELYVVGMDNPDRIMSSEFDIAAAFESTELTVDDHEKITTRLRNGVVPYQQLIVDCNPGAPSHWLNQRANAGGMVRLLSRHEDNPTLWDPKANDGKGGWTPRGEAYIGILDRLSGARRDRLRFGRWAQSEGVVYEGFDAAVNMLDAANAPDELLDIADDGTIYVRIPATWRRIRSIDFGYNNPFVCQWWAIDPDGRMYLYRELYGTRRLVQDWAPLIHSLSAGEKIEATVSDHDAEDRATLGRYGIPTIAATKAVTIGIQAVEARIRRAGDGRARLFIIKDALHERDPHLVEAKRPLWTGEEIEAYSYPRKKTESQAIKEEPAKEHDHGMDAMRYAVCYVDRVGREPVSIRVIGDGTSPIAKAARKRVNDDHLWNRL